MTVNFLLGRSGSGKTTYLVNKITEELKSRPQGSPIILLVPEQSTYQMERAILNTGELKGFTRLQILSFQRLAKKVLAEQGARHFYALEDTGKEMVLQNILLQRKDELSVLDKVATKTGFAQEFSRFISEAKMYQVGPEKLAGVRQKISDAQLRQKLDEIALIYEDYESFLGANNYCHQEDQLTMAAPYIEKSDLVLGSTCYVDSFFGFTPQEQELLRKMFKTCAHMEISLTLSPDFHGISQDHIHVFNLTLETYHQLRKIAVEEDVALLPDQKLFGNGEETLPRYASAPALSFLEEKWQNREVEPYPSNPENIKLIEASSQKSEIDKIAREIIALVRDKGWRYRDIALISQDIENYEPLIKAIFDDYEIPYFIDRKQPVHHHPLVEFIRALLETVIRDWDINPLCRMLKTGLLPLDGEEVFILENYILAHGISGAQWRRDEAWHYTATINLEDGGTSQLEPGYQYEQNILNTANGARRKVWDALKITLDDLEVSNEKYAGQKYRVREISTALWQLFETLDFESQLETWREEAKLREDFSQMQLHQQIWQVTADLFDQLVYFLGEHAVTLEEYLQILESGLSQVKLGLIPASLDQVIIGTLERTRPYKNKALFMTGLVEGNLPAKIKDTGLINDRERLLLRGEHLMLAPTIEEQIYQEQMLIYATLTQPTRMLYISYPLSDIQGKSLTPSTIVEDIKQLFPALLVDYQDETPTEQNDLNEYLVSARKAINHLMQSVNKHGGIEKLPNEQKVLIALIAKLCPKAAEDALELQGLKYNHRLSALSSDILARLYPKKIRSSVSGLENFAQCPGKFFAENQLKLQEREEYKLEPVSLGLFYHAGLKMFWDKLNEKELAWGNITSETAEQIIDEIMPVLSQRLKSQILLSSERNKYLQNKLRELLHVAVTTLAIYSNNEGFSPIGCELSFGQQGELQPVNIDLQARGKTLELRGRIDRIDGANHQGHNYIRVVDYKGKAKKLELKYLYHGIDLQLITYLLVSLFNASTLTGKGAAKPAGALYFGVENPIISTSGPVDAEQAAEEIKKHLSMEGILLKDEQILPLMTSNDENAQKLLPYSLNRSGDFSKNSSVLSEENFNILLQFTAYQLKYLGDTILTGEVNPAPYRDKNMSACHYCPYLPVCQFDLNFPVNRYRSDPSGGDWDFFLNEMQAFVRGKNSELIKGDEA